MHGPKHQNTDARPNTLPNNDDIRMGAFESHSLIRTVRLRFFKHLWYFSDDQCGIVLINILFSSDSFNTMINDDGS